MFTGIVEELAKVSEIETSQSGLCLTISAHLILEDLKLGDSISINGACQTVVDFNKKEFSVEVSSETLNVTTLGSLKPGDIVNLERALKLSDRLGGHIVNGHVDDIGELVSIKSVGFSSIYSFKISKELAGYAVYKGSICINGVSLTISSINSDGTEISVTIIPHSLKNTNLINLKPGAFVNIETDILGKYIEKLLSNNGLTKNKSNLTMEYLIEHGFA